MSTGEADSDPGPSGRGNSPGRELTVPLADLSDEALVAEAVAARRAMIAAELRMAKAGVELTERWESTEWSTQTDGLGSIAWEGPVARAAERAGQRAILQLAIACGVGEHWLQRRVSLAREAPGRLPALWQALSDAAGIDTDVPGGVDASTEASTGDPSRAAIGMDVEKAEMIHRETSHLKQALAREVAQEAADLAPRWITPAKTRLGTERLAAQADPDAFADLVKHEHSLRGVRYRGLGKGMSELRITGEATSVLDACNAIDQLASASPDGDRSPGAHRSDVALDTLIAAAGASGESPKKPPAGQEPAAQSRTTVTVLVPLATLLGEDVPAELNGSGMIPAQLAREIISVRGMNATWRCAYTAPRRGTSTKVPTEHITILGIGPGFRVPGYRPPPMLREYLTLRDRTCRVPGCSQPARRCDLDHCIPYDRSNTTCDCNVVALCRHHHQLKQSRRGVPLADAETSWADWHPSRAF